MRRTLVITAVIAAAVGIGGIAAAQTIQYRAQPAGEFEVPAVETSAEADFKLKVAADGMSATYDLKINEPIDDATMAHLHLAPVGSNAGVVVWLYPHDGPPAAAPNGEDFTGRLAKDTITPDDLVGALAGNWDGFLQALEDGQLYVNVHTTAHPGGEIRDQVGAHPHG
jgi:hypothetical protein